MKSPTNHLALWVDLIDMIYTYTECRTQFGSDRQLAALLAEGKLYKVDRGLYSDRPYEKLLAIAEKRYPEAVVSLDSAFFYQGLTDVVPERLHLSTARDTTKIPDKRIRQHFVPAEILHVGEVRIMYNGSSVLTYDLERLCIDVVRYRNKLPCDLQKEVILSLRSRTHEMYPAKIDDYLDAFPFREKVLGIIEKEIF